MSYVPFDEQPTSWYTDCSAGVAYGQFPSNIATQDINYGRKQYIPPRNRPRYEHPNKRRHSVDALDFSKDWVYDVPSFLRTLRLHKYIGLLSTQNVTLEDLLLMSEENLTNIGITTQGARKRMYLALQKYRKFMDDHNMPAPKPPTTSPSTGTTAGSRRRASAPCVPALSSWITSDFALDISSVGEDEVETYDLSIEESSNTTDSLSLEELGARLLDDLLNVEGTFDSDHYSLSYPLANTTSVENDLGLGKPYHSQSVPDASRSLPKHNNEPRQIPVCVAVRPTRNNM